MQGQWATREDTDYFRVGYDNDVWYEDGVHGEKRDETVTQLRTSLVIDPPDGRIPRTEETRRREAAALVASRSEYTNGPEDRSDGQRCIVGFNAAPPLNPSVYNNNIQIFQTPDVVVVLSEMNHDARVIPLDDRPRLISSIPQWMGHSRGRWQGDTLVVETDSFVDQTGGPEMRLIESFTRLDGETLRYEYTVIDLVRYSAPWTARVDMHPTTAIYEYACHEGNYSLPNALSASRAADRNAGQR